MALTEEHATWFAKTFSMIVENVGLALLGKEEVIRLALTAMLAEGHPFKRGSLYLYIIL